MFQNTEGLGSGARRSAGEGPLQQTLSSLSRPIHLHTAHLRGLSYKNPIKIRIFNVRRVKVFQIPRPARSFQPSDKENKELCILNNFILPLIFIAAAFAVHENKNERKVDVKTQTILPNIHSQRPTPYRSATGVLLSTISLPNRRQHQKQMPP